MIIQIETDLIAYFSDAIPPIDCQLPAFRHHIGHVLQGCARTYRRRKLHTARQHTLRHTLIPIERRGKAVTKKIDIQADVSGLDLLPRIVRTDQSRCREIGHLASLVDPQIALRDAHRGKIAIGLDILITDLSV